MSSKKFDNQDTDVNENQVQSPETGHTPTEDWRPDYFPTSAKPIFKRIGILTISILFLCLFLGYCSHEDKPVDPKQSIEKENLLQSEEDNDSEIFE